MGVRRGGGLGELGQAPIVGWSASVGCGEDYSPGALGWGKLLGGEAEREGRLGWPLEAAMWQAVIKWGPGEPIRGTSTLWGHLPDTIVWALEELGSRQVAGGVRARPWEGRQWRGCKRVGGGREGRLGQVSHGGGLGLHPRAVGREP